LSGSACLEELIKVSSAKASSIGSNIGPLLESVTLACSDWPINPEDCKKGRLISDTEI
jgi:hypothetical protein